MTLVQVVVSLDCLLEGLLVVVLSCYCCW